jgi:hypothetical protein
VPGFVVLMSVSLAGFTIPDNSFSQENEFIFNSGFQFPDLINKFVGSAEWAVQLAVGSCEWAVYPSYC